MKILERWKNWIGAAALLIGLGLAAWAVWRDANPPASLVGPSHGVARPAQRGPLTDYVASVADHLRFAVVGDFGDTAQPEADVAVLIKSWNPDFIVTTGDNNYPDGASDTIDVNIGQYFHEYVFNYQGAYGAGAAVRRFFPVLGDHDWRTAQGGPHLEYFDLPGNERYYDFIWGPVQFFMLNANPEEPDGVRADSVQAVWLRRRLRASQTAWQVVVTHFPPYSSGQHGSTDFTQWPYAVWGADLVLSGHDHLYERLERDGGLFVISGAGGRSLYEFREPVAGSQVRYNADYGALLVEGDAQNLTLQFITRVGEVIDLYTLTR